MNTKNVIVGVLVALVVALGLYSSSVSAPSELGGLVVTNREHHTAGIDIGSTKQFTVSAAGVLSTTGAISTTGSITATNSGTSTLNMKSTSATKGFCLEFNATSSATVMNMTYAASSTAPSVVGIAPIIRYGACN